MINLCEKLNFGHFYLNLYVFQLVEGPETQKISLFDKFFSNKIEEFYKEQMFLLNFMLLISYLRPTLPTL